MLSKPVAQGCEHCVFQVNSLRLGRSARCNARVRAQADGARIDVSDLYLFANLIELAGAALDVLPSERITAGCGIHRTFALLCRCKVQGVCHLASSDESFVPRPRAV